jgi:hypothetical protein
MRRREFITLLSGAAAWPLAARAQQPALPAVGFLYGGVPELSTSIVAAFRKGLGEVGFVEGRNVTVEFRFAQNDNARLAELAADLVRREVAVIVTPGSTPGLRRAKDEGKQLGRPPMAPALEQRIRDALNKPGRTEGVRKIAARFGVNPGTVQRISSSPFVEASAALA